MDGTIGADGFVLAEAAGFCSFLSIIKQLLAIGAEIIFSMVIPAVNSNHLMDCLNFSIDALFHEIRSVVLKMLDKHERKSQKTHA
jgi:hypothetical protein